MTEAAPFLTWRLRAFADHSAAEWHEILVLRAAVFVVEQVCAYQDPDGLDPGAYHLSGYRGAALVAYARFFPEEDHLRLGRIVTAPAVRGQGVGRALMAKLLGHVGDREAFLHAQTYLVPFYASYGFVTEGAEFPEDGIPHIAMRRPSGA